MQRTIRSRYFDTEDGRLAAQRLSLRLRKADGAWEQTLKAPGPSAVERAEDTVARPGKWGTAGPEVQPELHVGVSSGKALRAALGHRDDSRAALLPVHESLIKRLAAEVTVDATRVEIAFDRGTLHAGPKSAAVCEVEYELKAGDPAVWVALARADVARFGLVLSTVSKAARADRLARGVERGPAVTFDMPKIPTDADGAALFRRVAAACLEQIIGNAAETELVALRFGRRRTQAYLAHLKPAQDVVGSHVDLLLARRAAGTACETDDPKAWFKVGWLGAEIAHSARRARKALARAARAPGFW